MRQIYMKKASFTEEELNLILNRITSDKKAWLDSMMKEELGLFEERFESPVKIGLIMLVAFIAGGLFPILLFVILPASQTSPDHCFCCNLRFSFLDRRLENNFHQQTLVDFRFRNGLCGNIGCCDSVPYWRLPFVIHFTTVCALSL